MEPLTSLKNPKVKEAVKLRSRRHRDALGAFLIEGYRELRRAVAARLSITELYVCPELFLGENENELIREAVSECGAREIPVVANVFQKMAYRERPEGLLAVAPKPTWGLERLTSESNPFYLIACTIEKPGNLGTILRSADAAGCDGVIVCDRCTDLFNPNVVRASIGTLFTVPVVEADSDRLLPWLAEKGVRTVATSPAATQTLWDVDLTGPMAIVVGSEQYGLDARWLESADSKVQIPMHGAADSLNAAAATAILLYEGVRQRR